MKRILAFITAALMLICCAAAEAEGGYRIEINQEENTIRCIFTDEKGKATEGPDGCAIIELEYAKTGNWPAKVR